MREIAGEKGRRGPPDVSSFSVSSMRGNRPCRKDDKKAAKVSARAFHQRDPSAIRYAADRICSVKFTNLGSYRVACRHGYDRLTNTLREECEKFGAL